MIELAAGYAEAGAAGLEARGRSKAAAFGVLVVAFGLMMLPAAVALLALWGLVP